MGTMLTGEEFKARGGNPDAEISDGGKYNSDLLNKSSSSSSSGGNTEDAIRRAIQMQQEANKPAIASLQASIPETTQKYATQRTQLEAEKDPLKMRYQSLLDQIKGNQTTAENRQTVTTSNELGKRGILGSSGVAQQEMTNALNPITQQYTGLYKDTGLAQESDLRSLQNTIASLLPQETADTRAIQNAIAQLTAGASSAGITQGLQTSQLNQNQSQFDTTQNALKKQQELADLIYKTISLPESQYKVNAPYYKPTTPTSLDVSDPFR